MTKKRTTPATAVSASVPTALQDQMDYMKQSGYAVFPATMTTGSLEQIEPLSGILNFSGLMHHDPSGRMRLHRGGGDPLLRAGGISSSGTAMPHIDGKGTEGKGYITWGGNNNLPNVVALAVNNLVYTALPAKFNIDTLCGLGVEPTYHFHASVGCNENEEEIAYEHAGSYLQGRILKLRKELFNLLKDYEAPEEDTAPVSTPSGEEPPSDTLTQTILRLTAPLRKAEDDDETSDDAPVPSPSGESPSSDTHPLRFKRHAAHVLEAIVRDYEKQIARLERDYVNWARTWARLKVILANSNQQLLMHDLATDMHHYNIVFPELLLSQDATRQPDSSRWNPKIVGIRWRDAQTCRLEEKDDEGVSRYVYVSNQWLDNPGAVTGLSPDDIAAIPALDPSCAAADLTQRVQKFRSAAASARDRHVETDEFLPASRPCRFILPVQYRTTGRPYYPQPAFWTLFRDIYEFASNILRDRAIRKKNESSFSFVLYVHQEYLDQLTRQVNAQKTEEEKKAIKHKAIEDIKAFISNKQNNGSTLAAVTFRGVDGKDHDAFRVERIDYNSKAAAEADKTEITDISSILMFAQECNPDLIGSTPGGASSSGGTYQREMLLIKQAKAAPMQNLLLTPWYVIKEYSKFDSHLHFRIKQKTLTTLDNSKTGMVEE